MMKLICSPNSPPIGGLAAAELIKENYPVTIEWSNNANENTILLPGLDRPVPITNNDILRVLARTALKLHLYGNNEIEHTQIDHWLTHSLGFAQDITTNLQYLQKCLAPITYLVANKLTIADLGIFTEIYRLKLNGSDKLPNHVQRWYSLIASQACVAAVLSIDAVKNAKFEKSGSKPTTTTSSSKKMDKEKDSAVGDRKQEGKFVDLPGAEMGKVVVRFPPEASGYLHIGHAKAALLNQYYQQAFKGKLIMRFDDTNPAKETVEFEQVILGDLEMLEIKPDLFTHTSQYFDLMLEYCEQLLREGKAYVDDTNAVQMKIEREQKVESTHRSNSVDTNFNMWREMLKGSTVGQTCCVRAKIDMSSPNGCLRDPTIYRCKNEPHPRTGTQYKVYPTYDFACPIVDAIENVTHTLRTMEYHDRDDQFYWFIDALKLRKPYIWEYSRLNMTNTVLSKRKLTWFVDEGFVDGWDDPRFPTVRGILRRGMTVKGLKEFIIAQGSSKSVVFMEWDKIWAFNKKVIDPIAPRHTALDKKNVIVNVAGQKEKKSIQVAAHPKNADVGMKTVWLGPRILIDTIDANELKVGEYTTFINWGNMMIDRINRDKSGNITSVDATPNLENKDFKKTLKLTWLCEMEPNEFPPTICVYFDHIISKGVLAKTEDFKDFIGKNTRTEVEMLGDPELKKCKKGDIIQLTRRGFFKVDNAYAEPSEFSGVTSPVVLFEIPDGHMKEKPATSGQPKKAESPAKDLTKSTTSAVAINDKIVKQGDLVRDLKAKKADKATVDSSVKELIALKAEYKSVTGQDWKPSAVSASVTPATTTNGDINDKITKQGDLVRELKGKKAPKPEVDAAVAVLLALKTEYKATTGQDWKPNTSPVSTTPATSTTVTSTNDINDKITKQGDLVRELKGKKAPKPEVDTAVAVLLALKAEYKKSTGQDWKPNASPVSTTSTTTVTNTTTPSAGDINDKITKQGDLVRELKGKKASKPEIDAAVAVLLALKTEYKTTTGQDWKPGVAAPQSKPAVVTSSISSAGDSININIRKQGDLVRDLKAKKAKKPEIDEAVKELLKLKTDFKAATGQDWKPDSIAPVTQKVSPPSTVAPVEVKSDNEVKLVEDAIAKQGEKIRDLKAKKVDKSTLTPEIEKLLSLKSEFKKLTGNDWKPNTTSVATPPSTEMSKPSSTASGGDGDAVTAITNKITEQGNAVRNLKASGGSADSVKAAVEVLTSLKSEYKTLTGIDFPVAGGRQPSKPKGESKPKAEAKPKSKPAAPAAAAADAASKDDQSGGPKKQTRLGLEARKEENLPEWYSQIITKSELIEYYDVSGCYILRPWAMSIWRAIHTFLQDEITKLGVKEVYFPMFVSKSALEKEKDHIADFSPEVAWVTKSGDSELAEPIAIRPTSETIMYPAFAKWIQSYRDLPLRVNQWSNVVRWEFKHPQPFLRTREFLWQEGHTAFASQKEAEDEVLHILELYAQVYEKLLAIPVRRGRKSEKEKFAGGDYTTTVEAFVSASGRSIQGATSHHLGQNFSKMFDIIYDDPVTQEKKHVYQNSWGLTTRTVGVMILIHGDDKGLVLPPRVAPTQAIIVPCGVTVNTSEQERDALQKSCKELEATLRTVDVRAEGDYRDNYSPGWKFNHWELKGVPIRIELGPKDMKSNQIVCVRRDTGEKLTIARVDIEKQIPQILEKIQNDLFDKAQRDFENHLVITKDFKEFCAKLDKKNILLSPYCGGIECEGQIKDNSAITDGSAEPGAMLMGAKSLCIPFEQPAKIADTDKCINPNCQEKPKFYTLFGRSY